MTDRYTNSVAILKHWVGCPGRPCQAKNKNPIQFTSDESGIAKLVFCSNAKHRHQLLKIYEQITCGENMSVLFCTSCLLESRVAGAISFYNCVVPHTLSLPGPRPCVRPIYLLLCVPLEQFNVGENNKKGRDRFLILL